MSTPISKFSSILEADYKELNLQNLTKVRSFLYLNLTENVELTPSEPFDWEDEFLEKGGNEIGLESLKKSRPGFGDIFILKDLKLNFSKMTIIAQCFRITDMKVFEIDLHLLETKNANIPDFDLLKDFTIWYYSVHK